MGRPCVQSSPIAGLLTDRSSHFSRYRMHHHIATDRQPAIASTGTTYSSRVQRVLLYTSTRKYISYPALFPLLVSRRVPGSRVSMITAASSSTIMGRRRISIRSARTSIVTISWSTHMHMVAGSISVPLSITTSSRRWAVRTVSIRVRRLSVTDATNTDALMLGCINPGSNQLPQLSPPQKPPPHQLVPRVGHSHHQRPPQRLQPSPSLDLLLRHLLLIGRCG